MSINLEINEFPTLCEEMIYSNEYADDIISFAGNINYIRERYQPGCIQVFTDRAAVIYRKRIPGQEVSIQTLGYAAIPKIYGLLSETDNDMISEGSELEEINGRTSDRESERWNDRKECSACDISNIEEAGVLKLRRQPYFDLTGQGVIVGIVDTGIDYQNPLFRFADGSSRILKIWDQTIPYFDSSENERQFGTQPEGFLYGTVFSKEELERTMTGTPLTQDAVGHGTVMASLAAGNIDREGDFTGIAYLADLMVVKLKPSKEYLKEYYGISPGVLCYSEADIILGVSYLLRQAEILGKPIVICLGVGTNMGGHNGVMPLPAYLTNRGDFTGVGIVTAGGNETNRGHHYRSGELLPGQYEDVELNVAERENGFTLELWAENPALFSVGLISPTGEFFEKIPARLGASETIRFLLEPAVVKVDYEINEGESGDQLIVFRFFDPTPGIWRIRVYHEGRNAGKYDMWLPLTGFIREQTMFLRPDPEITVCDPGNGRRLLVSGAYDHIGGGIYAYSSRGYVRSLEERVVPTLCAPGVDVYVPVGTLRGSVRYGRESGTSIAAAHVAGVSALLMEWGVLEGNDLEMDTNELMKLLIRGAKRDPQVNYPNRTWGYGKLDLFGAFESLRPSL